MKTNLDHLPEAKRRELERVVEILFAEFEDALKGRNAPHRKAGRILKIILFGSYARGDWVDDPVGGYKSDYDLLVVVNHEELTDTLEYWAKADDHLLREYQIAKRLSAPANFIVHSLSDVNKQLKKGRPFFVDIVRDGIALYEAPDHPFEQPQPLSRDEARKEAQGYFDEWFPSAGEFFDDTAYGCRDARSARSKEAAFHSSTTSDRALLPLPASGADALQPEVPQAELPALPCRTPGAGADRGLAQGDQVRAAVLGAVAPGLCRCPVLAALQDHGRGTGVARGARRPGAPWMRPRLRRDHLPRADRGAG